MPSLNYKKEFAQLVETGAKPHTVRAKRKYPIKAGDHLYHYTGMRTKYCRKLGESTCTAVQKISITESTTGNSEITVELDGITLAPIGVLTLAVGDGFKDELAFKAFFKESHGLPFTGQLIHWNPKELNNHG